MGLATQCINGASGATEVGFTGAWTANASSTIVATDLTYGILPTTGGSIGSLSNNVNRFGGARTVSTTALADNGLLDDGATLWFSVEAGFGTGGNVTNSRLGFALANSSFNTSNFNYNIANEGLQQGSGLGLTLGRFNNVNGVVSATQFGSGATGNGAGFGGNVFGTASDPLFAAGQSGLIVGRITWGATDIIDLFLADTDLNIGSAFSTLSVSVDQSAFDTITWARGDVVVMDEIRFGATLADVAPIPEPSSLGFLCLGALAMLRRRR